MANHKNAKKTIRQIAKRTLINKSRNSDVKTIIKKVLAALEAKDLANAQTLFIQAQKKIDMACGKGLFKKRNASRKVSSLSLKIKALKQSA
jgi:small subunit ribosomal protein S20